jgi:drug/metabolite transporter (DMT)-like permease
VSRTARLEPQAVQGRESGRPGLGVLLVLGSATAFAFGPVGARLAFEAGGNTPSVVALRGLVAVALMALLVPLLGQGFRLDRRAWSWTLACGAFQAVAVWGFLGAVARVPVGVAVLVFFTHVFLLAAIAHVRGAERLTLRKLLLIGAALGGLALVVGAEFGTVDAEGVALAGLSAVAITGMILCIGRAQAHATSTQVNLYATAAATLGIALLTSGLGAWALPSGGLGWLGVVAAGMGVGLGLLAFFAALRHLGLVRASVLCCVEPLLSILLAAAILGETLRPLQWLGALVIIAALALFEAAGRR